MRQLEQLGMRRDRGSAFVRVGRRAAGQPRAVAPLLNKGPLPLVEPEGERRLRGLPACRHRFKSRGAALKNLWFSIKSSFNVSAIALHLSGGQGHAVDLAAARAVRRVPRLRRQADHDHAAHLPASRRANESRGLSPAYSAEDSLPFIDESHTARPRGALAGLRLV
jgi:hypothetical protein